MSGTSSIVRAVLPRDPRESHRVATPLELLTDLCFVVAVAQAALTFHHAINENHLADGVIGFALAFFAIWWTWLNFTWFASAYDNDDAIYRLLTIGQIVGSLVLAVGVPRLSEDATLVVVGYVIMRIALVGQWLRAARHDADRRSTCLRYAAGITLVQLLWIATLFLPHSWFLVEFMILVVAELAVPVLAERIGGTTWHADHIAERYSLFFIIVLGENVLSVATGIENALTDRADFTDVAAVAVAGVLIVFSCWWIYFSRSAAAVLERHRRSGTGQNFLWGFGHYLIFASTAAIGSGLAARVDYRTHVGHASSLASAAVLTVAAAVLLSSIWFLHLREHDRSVRTAWPFGVAVLAVLTSTLTPYPELITGVVCGLLLAAEIRVAGLTPGSAD